MRFLGFAAMKIHVVFVRVIVICILVDRYFHLGTHCLKSGTLCPSQILVPAYQITEHYNAGNHNTESCKVGPRGCAGEYTVVCVEIEVLYAHCPKSAIFSSTVHIYSTRIAWFHLSSFSLFFFFNF